MIAFPNLSVNFFLLSYAQSPSLMLYEGPQGLGMYVCMYLRIFYKYLFSIFDNGVEENGL